MPRRRGKDKNPKKTSSGTQYEQQDEGKQRQSARRGEQADTQDYRQQRRTGQRSTRSAH